MVSPYLKLFRSSGDELDNAIVSDIVSRLLIAESQLNGASTEGQDPLQVLQPLEHDFLEVFDCCYHAGYTKKDMSYYLVKEPDFDQSKLLLDFNYRSIRLLDQSGFGNHAYIKGRPRISMFQNTQPNYSLHFDGNNDRLTIAHTADFDFTTNGFTFSLWLYPETWGAVSKNIIDRTVSGLSNGAFMMYSDSGNLLNFEIQNDVGSDEQLQLSSIADNGVNKWYHVIVRYNGSTLLLRCYYDPVNYDEIEVPFTGSITLNDPLQFGTSTNSWRGNMDEIIFYKRGLDDSELDELHYMDEELLIPVQDMILWLGFNDKYYTETFRKTGSNAGKTKDLCNYNTATIVGFDNDTGATFSGNVPEQFALPFQYKDFAGNFLNGYKFRDNIRGQQPYLHIPETSDELRLKDRDTWIGFTFSFVIFDADYSNVFHQFLFCKYDDENANYGYNVMIGEDRRLLVNLVYNGNEKKVMTSQVLPANTLIEGTINFDMNAILANSAATSCISIAIDGFSVAIETNTHDSNFPNRSAPINEELENFDFVIGRSHVDRGFLCHGNQLFSLRFYEDGLDALERLSIVTNKHTIFEIPLGQVAHLNLTPLIEESPYFRRFNEKLSFNDPTEMELCESFVFDLIPTGRRLETVTIGDPDDFRSIVIIPVTGHSADINLNDYMRLPVITPVSKQFSLTCWVKLDSVPDGWGTIVSNIDGLKNGNNFMINATTLRWFGQFDSHNDSWKDLRVTIASITGAWHQLGLTYDGADPDRLRFYLDGKMIKEFHVDGPIISGDEVYSFVGKLANGQFRLDGKIDRLGMWTRELTPQEMTNEFLQKPPNTSSAIAFYYFEENLLDSTEQNLDGANFGISFSSDIP